MPYEHRFGFKNKRNDCRHDPAHFGIFIHGGSSIFPFIKPTETVPWEVKGSQRYNANRFSLTLPTRNRKGQEIPDSVPASISDQWYHPFPTFALALAYAKTMRVKHPILADCHIYACTDCVMESSSSGRCAVQLVSPSHIYRPNGLGPIRNQWPHYEALAA